MINTILAELLSKLASWLFAKVLEFLKGQQQKDETNEDIDEKLQHFKAAYHQAFDGSEVTSEQREKLKQSIRDFLRNPNVGGM